MCEELLWAVALLWLDISELIPTGLCLCSL